MDLSLLRTQLANWILGPDLNAKIAKGHEVLLLRRLRFYGYEIPDNYADGRDTLPEDKTYAQAIAEAERIVRGSEK